MITVAVSASSILFVIGLLIEPFAVKQQYEQMQDTLSEALDLDGNYPIESLPAHIQQDGISVVIQRNGNYYGSGPLADAIINYANLYVNTYVEIRGYMPQSRSIVIIAATKTSAAEMWIPMFAIGFPTILATLAIVGITLLKTTKIALQPLDDMTKLATEIAEGETGKRLKVEDPNTELGRTAVAFDKMLDSLEASLRRAKQAEERLRQLCADVAHELQSPLASIVASADNLMRSTGLKNQRQISETTALSVVRDGQRASRILSDLTLAAQFDVDELAKRQLIMREVDLVTLISETVASFAGRSEHKVTFTTELKPKSLIEQADPERIQQILVNLLANSDRHARTKIDVSASLEQQSLLVTVHNDGPSIPPKKQEEIFERFVRLDQERDRSKGGSGLGLNISRSLAEAHGGSLRAVSVKKGAAFELRLPLSQR